MKKFIRRLLVATLVMVVAAALVGLLEHYRRKIGLAEYKAELVKQGAEFDIVKLSPATPPPEQNAGAVLGDLIGRLQTNPLPRIELAWPMKMTEPGRARVEWQQSRPDDTVQTATWETAANTIAANESVLSEIRRALKRPYWNDGLDYQQGFSLSFNPLLELRNLRQWLSLSAIVNLRQGDTTAAIEDVEALLNLTRGQRQELLLIYQMMAFTVEQSALTTTWELLQAKQIEDEDLARLQSDWLNPQKEAVLVQTLVMERAMALKLLAEARLSEEKYHEATALMGLPDEDTDWANEESGWWEQMKGSIQMQIRTFSRSIKMKYWQYYSSYTAEKMYLELSENVLAALNRLQTNQPANVVMPEFERQHAQIVPEASELDVSLASTESVLHAIPGNSLRNESARRITGVAIALKRYQLKHGEWPETLVNLVPAYLARVPTDPADGKPLRYSRKPDNEFLLYALGENMMDDSGDPSSAPSPGGVYGFLKGKDMVWPMPVRE